MAAAEDVPSKALVGEAVDAAAVVTSMTRMRFLVGLAFCLSSGLSSFLWLAFAPIQPLYSDLYGVDAFSVQLFSVLYYIAYLPASIVGLWVVERFGLGPCLMVGALSNLICAACYLAGASGDPSIAYRVMIVGQACAAMGQPLILNVIARVSQDWFPDRERDFTTAAMSQVRDDPAAAHNYCPSFICRVVG